MGPISARGKHVAAAEAAWTMSLFPTAADGLPTKGDFLGGTIFRTAGGLLVADDFSGGGRYSDGGQSLDGGRSSGGGRERNRARMCVNLAKNDYLEPGNQSSFRAA